MSAQFEAANVAFASATTTISVTLTVGAFPNRVLLTSLLTDNGGITTITDNGVADLTQYRSVASTLALFTHSKVAPSAGFHTISVTVSVPSNLALSVRSYYNVNQVTPIATSLGASSVTSAIALSSGLTGNIGNLAVDFLGWSSGGSITATENGGQTERFNQVDTVLGSAGSDLIMTATLPTMDWALSLATPSCLIGTVLQAEQDQTPDRTMPCQWFQSWS